MGAAVTLVGPSYVVISPGVIHITPVTLGLEGDQRVEVRSGLRRAMPWWLAGTLA